MFKKAKLVVGHGLMFQWLARHAFHSDNMVVPVVDFVEDSKTITTICRCHKCGKTFEFRSKK